MANVSLVDALRKADEELMGSPSLLGMTALTYPNYINSMRSTMFTAHVKQFVNLINPEFPELFTNVENIVGKYSSGYKEAKGSYVIYKKVHKFKNLMKTSNVYKMFVYDPDTDTYDVIERKVCQELTENFGYQYNNDVIDSLEEGDKVKKGDILYRSRSYDDDMNYGYGINCVVAYTLEPFTSEDAAIASKSICDKFTSIETESIRIGLNSNDYLINLYGDKKHYKPIPDIGTIVNDELVVSRRQFNNQLLFDFKNSSLNEIHEGDNIYHIDKNSEIIDIQIFNNNDERIENEFYDQIYQYYDAQMDYYTEIHDTCVEIMNSGSKYTREVEYLFKRAEEMLDTEKKWKDKESIFNNMEIEITYKRYAPLAKGSKITGRYGNKSVISEIRDDEDMPYTKDGRRVDILLNLLAIINRTTAMAIVELFMTGAAYQVRMKMKELSTLSEKEKMLDKFLRVLNEDQADAMHKTYQSYNKKEKEAYINDAIEHGILMHQTPMWETIPIFYRLQNLLKAFPFISKDDLYIRKWGREYKVLSKYFIGDMYIMKLKQSDRRGFSARSTGALNTKSLPTRSPKSKAHLERISSSCIRFGEFESFNFSIAMPSIDIVLFHALYRTSVKGRQDILNLMFEDDNDPNSINIIDSSYTSRVAEIFNVYLKCMGIKLTFLDDDDFIETLDNDELRNYDIDGKSYLCTEYQAYLVERINDIKAEILSKEPILTHNQLRELVEEELRNRKYIIGSVEDELDTLDKLILQSSNAIVTEKVDPKKKPRKKSVTDKKIVRKKK